MRRGDRPICPTYLSSAAKQAWKDLLDLIWEDGVLQKKDWPLIEQAAIAWADVRGLDKVVKKEGYLTDGSMGQPKMHPALTLRQQSQDRLIRLCDLLGIGPLSRQKVGGKTQGEEPAPALAVVHDLQAASAAELKALEKRLKERTDQS